MQKTFLGLKHALQESVKSKLLTERFLFEILEIQTIFCEEPSNAAFGSEEKRSDDSTPPQVHLEKLLFWRSSKLQVMRPKEKA